MIDQLIFDDISRNYLVTSSDISKRYMLTTEKLCKFMNISSENILRNPDIKYICQPKIDKSGKIVGSISNHDLLLNHYGLINKIDSNRIGNEITINQVRDLISFTQISAHKSKKIVIINNVSKMNNEASSALLKTLEEVTSNCSFILLCNSSNDVHETIRSRCQTISIDSTDIEAIHKDFNDYFYSKHEFLKKISEEYNLDNMLVDTVTQIEGLLNKTNDPIEIANIWDKTGVKLIIEVICAYITFITKNIISTSLKNKLPADLKKLSNIYEKIPNIKTNISMNISSKYLLNNLSIELAT